MELSREGSTIPVMRHGLPTVSSRTGIVTPVVALPYRAYSLVIGPSGCGLRRTLLKVVYFTGVEKLVAFRPSRVGNALTAVPLNLRLAAQAQLA